jgi:hypothetical protein
MKRVIKLLIILVIIFSNKVNAWYCDYKFLANLKNLASNIKYTYNYKMVNGSPVFNITLTNIPANTYIINDSTGGIYYPKKNMDEVTFYGFKDNKSYEFTVRTNELYCEETVVSKIYVPLPAYNKYFNDPLCTEFPNHSLCQRWNTVNISYEEFKSKMIKFKEEELQKEYVEPKENKWLKLYLDYYYIILPAIIIFCLGYIYNERQKDTFGF